MIAKTHGFESLAYLGAYGAYMFALRVWVGHGASKTFFLYTLQMILLGLT